jgi:hypothetical protein
VETGRFQEGIDMVYKAISLLLIDSGGIMRLVFAICFVVAITFLSCGGNEEEHQQGISIDISKYEGKTVGEFLGDVGKPYDSFAFMSPISLDTVVDCIFYYPFDVYIRLSTEFDRGLVIDIQSSPDTWDIEGYKQLPIRCIMINAMCK